MANENLPNLAVPLVAIQLPYFPQITTDVADAAVKVIVPFAFRVRRVVLSLRAIGGSTPHTDIDVDVLLGANNIVTAAPIVDDSAIAGSGAGLDCTLTTTLANLIGAAGDALSIKLINITGGSSPTADGLVATVFVERIAA